MNAPSSFRLLGPALLISTLVAVAPMSATALTAPNVVVIDANLVTSGQPPVSALENLKAEGVEAVIYLAPATVSDAVKGEPDIVSRQGIEFIHIPIPFETPSESHFEAVSSALQRLQGKKVLVHCQVNMRASTMVFLFRVLHRKDSPATAYDAVTRVWSPQGPWRDMVQDLLKMRGVAFELY
ncbi:MAG: protein tyrosine phosphatase family protein [Rubrivivax sp.]|nr:protein tyrosine phosphatase family protein [Rubrivivax sp.]